MTLLEKDILEKINKGDREAFDLVFKRYFPGLCTFARDYVRTYDVAEDIVQEVFINFWIDRKKIQILISLKAFLYRCVYNRCLNYLRDINSHPHKISLDEGNFKQVIELSLPEITDTDFNMLFSEKLENELNKAIEDLPEKCKEIFIMCRNEHLAYPEIAKKLNLSLSTVKTQMSRAMSKLLESTNKYF